MIIVTGTITATQENFAEVLEASLAHVHASRREPGCISHQVAVDCENPMKLVFFEEWADMPALLTHFGEASAKRIVGVIREKKVAATGPTMYDATPKAQ